MILASRLESTLVFHKYVDQYFLEQIWSGGEQEGTQVPQSRSERTIRQQLSQTQYVWTGDDRYDQHRRQLVLIVKLGRTPVGAQGDHIHIAPTGRASGYHGLRYNRLMDTQANSSSPTVTNFYIHIRAHHHSLPHATTQSFHSPSYTL